MQFIIFSVKREIMEKYYHRAEVLRQFFLECVEEYEPVIHYKQLSYIVDSFPFCDFPLAEGSLEKKTADLCRPFFELPSGYDIIRSKNYCCLYYSESLWQAESSVFHPLRNTDHSFFIIELSGQYYGWIAPLPSARLFS
ncbi:UNVERIFIED_CONTAM: sporulation inhibitor of replication protein SirA [Halobacillus marinus]|uniref:sporulation inhibitor of replication protein SirA n=1 Tax=Bacillaceae TaxID=186817 RepID=UPI0002A4DA6D|nr:MULTISPECIES: sporulation inhibitor of replication protein SirA [Bacillaceae]ELK44302.1 hypothetical protein D479_19698 [Halobacillus sp. BAB-2008]QHT46750.1 hypothetical protein M662_09685 [Bacillus sp. SB49]